MITSAPAKQPLPPTHVSAFHDLAINLFLTGRRKAYAYASAANAHFIRLGDLFEGTLQITSASYPKKSPDTRQASGVGVSPGEMVFVKSVNLPVARPFVGKGVDQKINEGADLGLCKAARGVDSIDALGFHRQIGNGVNHKALFHRFGVEKAG